MFGTRLLAKTRLSIDLNRDLLVFTLEFAKLGVSKLFENEWMNLT